MRIKLLHFPSVACTVSKDRALICQLEASLPQSVWEAGNWGVRDVRV